MIYRIAQFLYKKAFIPVLELFSALLPRYIGTVCLLALADRLGLRNLRFDMPLILGEGDREPYFVHLTAVPGDRSVLPYIAHKQMWEIDEPRMVHSHMKNNQTYEIVDAGANMGLFTFQLLAMLRRDGRLSSVARAHLIEPDPKLTTVLSNNCEQFISEGVVFNIVTKAIGTKNGTATFYLDEGNNTNNSLRPEAIEISPGSATQIEVEVFSGDSIKEVLGIASNTEIIYKSDLQGSDTDVLFAIPDSFLAQIDILIFEIWPRIFDAKALDIKGLFKKLSQFNHIVCINGATGREEPLSVDLLQSILSANSKYDYVNVFCSRS
jgi:FkbM family methyltransferase